MKTTNTTELIREMEQQIRDLKLENAELSCDGTQAREALTRARARIEELKELMKDLLNTLLDIAPSPYETIEEEETRLELIERAKQLKE
jgi:TolA-binding protein